MSDTKKSILFRVTKAPSFEIVPEHAIALFDKVISETEAEAMRLHPKSYWDRVEFWKREILDAVAAPLRGLVAVQVHEYFAALLRNEEEDLTVDIPSYGGEARAQHDAYMACCASLS
jgi:hypothetical protein